MTTSCLLLLLFFVDCMLGLASYNQLTINGRDRREDIEAETRNFDVVGLQGTQIKERELELSGNIFAGGFSYTLGIDLQLTPINIAAFPSCLVADFASAMSCKLSYRRPHCMGGRWELELKPEKRTSLL